jgi:hypothetical protein
MDLLSRSPLASPDLPIRAATASGEQPVSSLGPRNQYLAHRLPRSARRSLRTLQAWLSERDRKAAGAAWEVYWWIDPAFDPDPANWPPPAEWRCELVQPVA